VSQHLSAGLNQFGEKNIPNQTLLFGPVQKITLLERIHKKKKVKDER